jgi:hypothetical protein
MTRNIGRALLLTSAVALLAGCAGAQYRDPYYRGPRQNGLIGRVLADLDSARSYARLNGYDRDHFDQARRDLLIFQDHYARGQFDKDRLDGAIENIHHLVDSNRVNPRDRRLLARDMEALRDFRASRGTYRGRY